jgi:anoctamin-10
MRAKLTNNGTDGSATWPLIIGIINGIQIRIMTFVDFWISNKLTDWENHEKLTQRENAVIIKMIMFEFMNKYFSIFYIAFYKPYVYEYCMGNNCLHEIEIQLYVILFVYSVFQVFDILTPVIKNHSRKKALAEKIKNRNPEFEVDNFTITPLSHEHQIMCDEMTGLIYEYNTKIILFGYVCFFSVAAPLTPLIIFLITYIEKHADCYKLFYLYRSSIIEGASGISIYNRILKAFFFIGMVVNLAVVLFASPGLINVTPYQNTKLFDNTDFLVKLLIICIFENLLLLVVSFLSFNTFPDCK